MKDSDFSKLLKSKIEDARIKRDNFILGSVEWFNYSLKVRTISHLAQSLEEGNRCQG